MTKLIYHAGTDTFFDADDDVFVIDTNSMTEDEQEALGDGDDGVLESVIDDGRATPLFLSDMTWANTVSYSPSAIREEIRESLYENFPDDEAVLDWAISASDADLNTVAGFIMNDDETWQLFIRNLIEGLRWGYEKKEQGTL